MAEKLSKSILRNLDHDAGLKHLATRGPLRTRAWV